MKSSPISFRSRIGAIVLLGVAMILAGCTPETETTDADPAPAAAPPTPAEVLEPLLGALPLEARSAIKANPQGFLQSAIAVVESRPLNWVLVDKERGLSPEFVPEDLIPLEEISGPLVVNRQGMLLERRTAEALAEMAEAAAGEGVTLDVSSAYRSYDYQTGLFDRHVSQLGMEEASRVSARPGHSQHQLGTVVDFGSITLAFADTAAGRWLAREAWRFGFSLSYPEGAEEITGYSYEPWHFRYLGTDATLLERNYFAGMQQWMLEFLDSHARHLVVARE